MKFNMAGRQHKRFYGQLSREVLEILFRNFQFERLDIDTDRDPSTCIARHTPVMMVTGEKLA